MKVKHFIIILCSLVLVTVSAFTYFYLKKRSPVEQMPVLATSREVTKLNMMYSFGNGGSKEEVLAQPLNLAVDSLGESFVIDSGNNRIKAYDPNGKYKLTFGKTDGPTGELETPSGIAIHNNMVLVSEPIAGRILAFSKTGEFVKVFFTTTGDEKYAPVGMVSDGNHLLFTDTDGHRVVEVDNDGKVVSTFGGPGNGDGQFAYPHGIAMDKNKRIYVSDSNNGRVEVFDRKGKFVMKIDGATAQQAKMALPRGIAIDPYNHLLVVDTLAHQIRFFELTGEPIYFYGELGVDDGQFNFPNGVAVDGKKIFVADRENNRIQVFTAGS